MIELLKLQTGLAETASHRGPKTAFIALFHFAACWRPTANIFITQLPQLMVHNYWTRNWSHIATHLVVLLVVVVLAWATLFKKKPKAPSFHVWLWWNLARLFFKYMQIHINWQSRIFNLTSHFQDGSHNLISCRKCCHLVSTHSVCPVHI